MFMFLILMGIGLVMALKHMIAEDPFGPPKRPGARLVR